MKNVAKCDTWCELQNPVNHRVFERKLRPRPLGRGHVCLGVTHRRPHSPRLTRRGRILVSRALPLAAGPKSSPRRRSPRRAVVERPSDTVVRPPVAPGISQTLGHRPSKMLSLRPQVRRDYPLSLSISISGGKETYKDSPSNGERTGKCPA
ncbi:hypothetical protein BDE02_08G203000 [Populus trichocarpa]|nr:hypothetical protein BDE02_08G203000 [Populus trichocarpa]